MNAFIDKIKAVRWVPTSDTEFAEAEVRILANIEGHYRHHMVPTPLCDISTISSVSVVAEPRSIVLLLHGFGFGSVQWVPNWCALVASGAEVHAIDLPGFGRSGHPKCSSDISPQEALLMLIQTIEEWIKVVVVGAGDGFQSPRLTLIGHSFGGYVAGKFAINYPHRVAKLILADAFGLCGPPPQEYFDNFFQTRSYAQRAKIWAAKKIFYNVGPPSVLRALGPIGHKVVQSRKGTRMMESWKASVEDPTAVADYLYHTNVRGGSGWFLLSKLVHGMGAHVGEGFHIRMPLEEELIQRLPDTIPLHFICGEQSWIRSETAARIQASRGAAKSCHVTVIGNAGHHVYIDQKLIFNDLVCSLISPAQTPLGAAPMTFYGDAYVPADEIDGDKILSETAVEQEEARK